jgi:hypothetical protein
MSAMELLSRDGIDLAMGERAVVALIDSVMRTKRANPVFCLTGGPDAVLRPSRPVPSRPVPRFEQGDEHKAITGT